MTGRCLSVEATIICDILSSKNKNTPASYVLWSALVGVLLSRGDFDTAVIVLNSMENINSIATNKNKIYSNNGNNNNNGNGNQGNYNGNNYNGNYNKNNDYNNNNNNINNNNNSPYKKTKINNNNYKASEISQTVELAILYSLNGGLPLLTENSPKALEAINLKRISSREKNENLAAKKNGDENKIVEEKENMKIQKFPLLEFEKIKSAQNLNGGISNILKKIPAEYSFSAAANRTVSTMGDVLEFLEKCRGDDINEKNIENTKNNEKYNESIKKKNLNSNLNLNKDKDSAYDKYDTYDDYNEYSTYDDEYTPQKNQKVKKTRVTSRVPIGVALLENLFSDAINDRKYKQAARIIRLLEGSRLVVDLETSVVSTKAKVYGSISAEKSTDSSTDNSMENNIVKQSASASSTSVVVGGKRGDGDSLKLNENNESSEVKIVRETLARKWAALLIGSSLNKLKNNVAGSVKLMAAMKYLQKEKEEKDEREKEMNDKAEIGVELGIEVEIDEI